MCNKKQIKFDSVKFRLIRPNRKRGRIINAANCVDLGYQLNDDFNFYDCVDVFFKGRKIGMLNGSWQPSFWWNVDPKECPQKIIDFFDPTGYWARHCVPETQQRWTDSQLEIIGGVK